MSGPVGLISLPMLSAGCSAASSCRGRCAGRSGRSCAAGPAIQRVGKVISDGDREGGAMPVLLPAHHRPVGCRERWLSCTPIWSAEVAADSAAWPTQNRPICASPAARAPGSPRAQSRRYRPGAEHVPRYAPWPGPLRHAGIPHHERGSRWPRPAACPARRPGRSTRSGSRPGSPAGDQAQRRRCPVQARLRPCGQPGPRGWRQGRTSRPGGTSGRSARLRSRTRLKTPNGPQGRR